MKYLVSILVIFISLNTRGEVLATDCSARLENIAHRGKISSYISFLIDKNYLKESTLIKLAEGKKLTPSEYEFSDSLNESQKLSLRRGIEVVFMSSEKQISLQKVVKKKFKLKKDQNQNMREVKGETKALWHSPAAIELREAPDFHEFLLGFGDRRVIRANNGAITTIRTVKDGIYLWNSVTRNLVMLDIVADTLSVLENPIGFNEPLIIIGLDNQHNIRVLNFAGKHLNKIEKNLFHLPTQTPVRLFWGFSSKIDDTDKAYFYETRTRSDSERRMIYNGPLYIADLNSGAVTKHQFNQYTTNPLETFDNSAKRLNPSADIIFSNALLTAKITDTDGKELLVHAYENKISFYTEEGRVLAGEVTTPFNIDAMIEIKISANPRTIIITALSGDKFQSFEVYGPNY